ncbi:MAG: protease modulator HflC [Phycisphaerae bacterium]|nr:protease modulator HflC [Phycisphaerae bacterium]
MRTTLIIIIILVVLAAIFAKASLYVVQEGQQAVITEFRKPVRVVTEAGLYFKKPFIQKVNRLEKRLLPWDGDPEHMQTRDKKRIFIDVWARWRIVDPMKFFQAVRTERGGYKILDDLVDSAVRDVVASNNLIEVVRSSNRALLYETEELGKDAAARQEKITVGRAKMEAEILQVASADLKERYGMELTVVHIKRVNYIENVRLQVYERMKSERDRISELFISQGKREQNIIIGQMQEELEGITGEMQKRVAEIRGQADAKVIKITAEGYSKSPEFYEFLRSLEAYKNSLKGGTRLILSSDNEFFKQLQVPSTGSKSPKP